MQKKTDRRVRKTKSQLKTGLAQLMREKSIREITVKELVDAVDINLLPFICIILIYRGCLQKLKMK